MERERKKRREEMRQEKTERSREKEGQLHSNDGLFLLQTTGLPCPQPNDLSARYNCLSLSQALEFLLPEIIAPSLPQTTGIPAQHSATPLPLDHAPSLPSGYRASVT